MSRHVVLHYHLFKNAGTSLDRILQQNFGDKWLTREFPPNGGDNSALVAEWIAGTPEAIAYSSHTMLGPVPGVDDVEIIPVILLRDPVERIRSAYRFERNQDADTWGAQLAKEHDFEGYVKARLERKGDRQCRNFQTERLASLVPGDAPELERATKALETIHAQGVVGLVDDFDGFLARLGKRLKPHYPDFAGESVRANASAEKGREPLDPSLLSMLVESNALDLEILDYARALTEKKSVPAS